MKQDRFLIGILIGIGLLVALSLALFFTRRSSVTYEPDDTPVGVVKNYVVALQKQDYDRAYSYLANSKDKPDEGRFRQAYTNGQLSITGTGMEVHDAVVTGDRANVAVTVIRSSGGLFSSVFREPQEVVLVRENGAWKITSMPYPYWNYDWYQQVKPVLPGG